MKNIDYGMDIEGHDLIGAVASPRFSFDGKQGHFFSASVFAPESYDAIIDPAACIIVLATHYKNGAPQDTVFYRLIFGPDAAAAIEAKGHAKRGQGILEEEGGFAKPEHTETVYRHHQLFTSAYRASAESMKRFFTARNVRTARPRPRNADFAQGEPHL